MYMTRPRPLRSHQRTQQQLQPEKFFQNGSLAWRYADDYEEEDEDEDEDEDDDDYDGIVEEEASSDSGLSPPQHMDLGHFRWFWPWGVRRSSAFDTMPAGTQRLPMAATLHPSSVFPQHQTQQQPRRLSLSSSTSGGSGRGGNSKERQGRRRRRECFLFSKLPPELRRRIWALVLQTQCSSVWTYEPRSPAWRPDRTGAPFIDAALLRTCRAVYMEAWDLPMRLTWGVLADGAPQDKPAEWAQVVLAAGVLVPHAWQVLLLGRVEVTLQHLRLEAGFLDMWVAALGRLKAAAAVCVADLVAEAEERIKEEREEEKDEEEEEDGTAYYLNTEVVRVLRERQAVEEIVVRMNRADWWAWTSMPPAPWPGELPGECVADIRNVQRRRRRRRGTTTKGKRKASREVEREWAEREERWMARKDKFGTGEHGLETDTMENNSEDEGESHVRNGESSKTDDSIEVTETVNNDDESQHSNNADNDGQNEAQEEGGYFSDYSLSESSSKANALDPTALPEKLYLEPLRPEGWDRPGAYGVLSPNLRIKLMLETFGPKSLQLDAVLDEVKTWRLPMPLMRDESGGQLSDVRAGSAVEDGTRVLAWDGRPVYEYHWLRDMSDEVGDAPFLKMRELKATAEGVVVKMMTLAPTRK